MIKPDQSRVAYRETTYDEPTPAPITENPEIDRLLCAAVVNPAFRALLLTNPSMAVAVGYHDDTFVLSDQEVALLQSVEATTLQEFAERLLTLEYARGAEAAVPVDRRTKSVKVRL
jgi:hypothetical protein